MAEDRSQYKIDIRLAADTSGANAAADGLKKVGDAAKDAGDKINIGLDADAFKKKAKPIEDLHEKLEVSGHEARHSIHLVGEALGELAPQLGEIGRLAPLASAGLAFLVPAAVIEAIGMLSEQLKKVHEQLVENIKIGQQTADMFRDNLHAAVLHSNEALAQFHDTMQHVGDQQDRLSQSLSRNISELHAQAEAATNLAKAEEALADARIQSGVLSGVTSGPQAAHQEEEARRRARAAEEGIHRAETQEEIAHKRAAARHAKGESEKAEADVDKAISDKPRLEAAVKDAKDLLDRATKDMDGLKGNLAEAKANGFAGQTVPEIRAGMGQGELDRRNAIIKANEELKFAQGQVDREQAVIENLQKKVSDLTIESTKNDAEIQRMTQRAEKMKEFADETARAADELERLEGIKEKGQSAVDAINDETVRVNRRNYLQGRVNSGKATSDEQAEYGGATERGVSAAIRDTTSKITSIENNIRFEGGHASADEVAQLVQLNDRLLGLLENVHRVTSQNQSEIARQESKIENLESTAKNNRYGY